MQVRTIFPPKHPDLTLNEFWKAVLTLAPKNNWNHKADLRILGMLEELGELTRAFVRNKDKIELVEELGDILTYWLDFCRCISLDPQIIVSYAYEKMVQKSTNGSYKYGSKFTEH